jgi:uncharacterized protein YecT (DUF1311 family)
MRIHLFVTAVILAITASANASEADVMRACKNVASGSYTDLNLCLAVQSREADAQLNQAYASALAFAADHPSAKEMVPSLRAAQRAWVTYRDRTCELSSWMEGWAYAPAKRPGCLQVLTGARIKELDEIGQCIKAQGFKGEAECPLSN